MRVFCGKTRLDVCAAQSAVQWNQGAGGIGNIICRMGIQEIGINTAKGIHNENNSRVKSTKQKCSSVYRMQRRQLRRIFKTKSTTKEQKSYIAGVFSVKSKPDFELFDNSVVDFQIDEPRIPITFR